MQRSLIFFTASAVALLLASTVAPQSAGAPSDRLGWWREARFGLIVHWGLYSAPAGEWRGVKTHGAEILATASIPSGDYAKLRERLTGAKLDVDAWVDLCKRSGARYFIADTKHADGFCLFDSEHTDYDITTTPFARDLMLEVAEAARGAGVRFGWYHSIRDWHHPDYLPRRDADDRPVEGVDFDRYVAYLHKQVMELLTRYGDVDVMWFDGAESGRWTRAQGVALEQLCRKLQPGVLINDGPWAGPEPIGDFRVSRIDIQKPAPAESDVESIIPLARRWSHNPTDREWKSAHQLIRKLVEVASKGGNLLLGIGPTAAGEIPEEALKQLDAVGRWLSANGEAIYGTERSPLDAVRFGGCTMRRSGDRTTLFLHVVHWPFNGELVVPGLASDPQSVRLFGDGTALAVRRRGPDVVITLPADPEKRDPDCTVIALDVDGAPRVRLAPRLVSISDVFLERLALRMEADDPDVAVHFTVNGGDPTVESPRYTQPITLLANATVRARSFVGERPVSGVALRRFRKVDPLVPLLLLGLKTFDGVKCHLFEGEQLGLEGLRRIRPKSIEYIEKFELRDADRRTAIGRRLNGLTVFPKTEMYEFRIVGDDAARILIDRTFAAESINGRPGRGTLPLSAGMHDVTVEWVNRTGEAKLEVLMGPRGGELKPLEDYEFVYVKD